MTAKKVLITGGTGTIGRAFMKNYPEYIYHTISRNESSITDMLRDYPRATPHIGNIEDSEFITTTFRKVKPDIVIHAAAVKHINLAELNPTYTCKVNVLGSLNIIKASIENNVPITIGISTDKACSALSVYGDTKALMERCFVESNNNATKFAVCRFANVAHSNGSVLPFWLGLVNEGKPLSLTDPNMNRLMFSQKDSAELIKNTIDVCEDTTGGFVCLKKMKSINMLDLANILSNEVHVVGSRPGEKLNEDLISDSEVDYTYLEGDYVYLRNDKNSGTNKLTSSYSSKTAERMNEQEIKDLIWNHS